MRKDSIDQKAIEAAYLIFNERGMKTVDYSYSHAPTDYARNTVMEPENNSKLKESFNELLPPTPRNAEFNSLAERDEAIEAQVADLQQAMRVSRQRGNFQQLQDQMRQMNALMKEKESIDAKMAVANLGAAQMDTYDDSMGQDDFSEMGDIGAQIAELEAKMIEFRESFGG
jgi:hypothetical protein